MDPNLKLRVAIPMTLSASGRRRITEPTAGHARGRIRDVCLVPDAQPVRYARIRGIALKFMLEYACRGIRNGIQHW